MKSMRDAAILLVLVLAVLSIRITPAENVAGIVPAAHAAPVDSSSEAEPIAPAIRSSSSPCCPDRDERLLPTTDPPPPPPAGEPDSLQAARGGHGWKLVPPIELQRDRSLEAVMESSPIDPDRSREAPAAGAAC
jgi:hypothetical protein